MAYGQEGRAGQLVNAAERPGIREELLAMQATMMRGPVFIRTR